MDELLRRFNKLEDEVKGLRGEVRELREIVKGKRNNTYEYHFP